MNGLNSHEHAEALKKFQESGDIFVWGHDLSTGSPWKLEEGKATEERQYVKNNVICPVPDCGESLTTVARSSRRDGLRHYRGGGNHTPESIHHANACALIESWLKALLGERYEVRREMISDSTGERRADVMAINPAGERIAFEVQYSAITVEEWQSRHDSYVRQGIKDVWFFGHTGRQFKYKAAKGLQVNEVQRRVLRNRMPLLYINPERELLAVATAREWKLLIGVPSTETVPTFGFDVSESVRHMSVTTFNLKECRAHRAYGVDSELLADIRASSEALSMHNSKVQILEVKRERIREERRLRSQKVYEERVQAVPRLRDLVVEAMNLESDLHFGRRTLQLVDDYRRNFGGRLYLGQLSTLKDRELEKSAKIWIWFTFIAGQNHEINILDIRQKFLRRWNAEPQELPQKLLMQWFSKLSEDGFLRRIEPSLYRYKPLFRATYW